MARLTATSLDADAAPREITPRAIVLGLGLALLLGSANAYLGLYAGMTVSASIPAAVASNLSNGMSARLSVTRPICIKHLPRG